MEAFSKLYDTNVLIEAKKKGKLLLEGCTTVINLVEYPKGALLGLKVLYPSKKEYKLAFRISEELMKRGTPIPRVDIIVAAVAIRRGLVLVTKDRHFEYIKEVVPELKLELVD
ncbi:type II toxin-antitoxin system VapC family toxin [Pyrococcus yayanosii]|uniref:PIN domain-containing protein n=1 Tax=Pyrococcus yayanosii (strain CH1 / JCM 16557) TaxID=529709 RepID=F8AI03_PYRYC|nr:type II toxin-antitoxin system VapC family toxin [Pyrococcus yayanosii]AEH25460.1 hypothetical protein PYCH_18030 [Pyrococcus yayanosii CH1]